MILILVTKEFNLKRLLPFIPFGQSQNGVHFHTPRQEEVYMECKSLKGSDIWIMATIASTDT